MLKKKIDYYSFTLQNVVHKITCPGQGRWQKIFQGGQYKKREIASKANLSTAD